MADSDASIDVEALVEDLRRRASAARDRAEYADDVGGGPVAPVAGAPRVRFRPELGYSSKPVIGPPITGVKRTLLRLQHHVLEDLARQTDAAIGTAEAHAEHALNQAQLATNQADSAAAQSQRAAEDVQSLMQRITALEDRLEHLQIGPRLARLERWERGAGRAAGEVVAAADAVERPRAATLDLDYLAFEARFRGSEELIAKRQKVYSELLAGRSRVVDIGCGRGELLEVLRDAGVEAYGIDTEPDFVALCQEKGLDTRAEEGVKHLEALGEQSIDGVVASHVVEHLRPADLTALIAAAFDALEAGGLLILETPNPESLVAGSINFHRDPTHLRPVHPDTLAFLCESAGFEPVEIHRMSPVPDSQRLPRAPDGAAGAEQLNAVVDRLNELIFGFQDYAVVATRTA